MIRRWGSSLPVTLGLLLLLSTPWSLASRAVCLEVAGSESTGSESSGSELPETADGDDLPKSMAHRPRARRPGQAIAAVHTRLATPADRALPATSQAAERRPPPLVPLRLLC